MYRILSGKVIIYLLLLFMCDACLMPVLRIGPLQPVLLYLMILYAAFQWNWRKTIPMALAVGVLRDVTGSHPLGVETSVLVTVALALSLVVQKVKRESLLMRVASTFLYVFAVGVLIILLSGFLTTSQNISWFAVQVAFGSAVFAAVTMPVFFHLTATWFRDATLVKQYELFG